MLDQCTILPAAVQYAESKVPLISTVQYAESKVPLISAMNRGVMSAAYSSTCS